MRRFIFLLAVMALVTSVGHAAAITISAADARSVRFGNNQYYLLDGLVVMYPEDRGILEYDVRGLDQSVQFITLDIWFGNLDFPGLPNGIIDVFAFTGDGVVTADDFCAGGPTPFTSFVAENGPEYGYASIDVTSAVRDALAAGEAFVGFRLSTETTDRYVLGYDMIRLSDPVLTAVPEPVTLLLIGLGGLALRRCGTGMRSRRNR